MNTGEGAQTESPSRNTCEGKSKCQELPFSSTPATLMLPTDQFSRLDLSNEQQSIRKSRLVARQFGASEWESTSRK